MSDILTSEKTRVEEITILHNEIARHLRLSLEKAIRVGELLAEQKNSLKHGDFMKWVSDNLPFTDRTARNYMKLFENRDQLKTETVSTLTSAYRLLSEQKKERSAQEETIKEIEGLKAKYQINDIPDKEAMWEEFNSVDSIEDKEQKITVLYSLVEKYNDYEMRAKMFRLEIAYRLGKLLNESERYKAICDITKDMPGTFTLTGWIPPEGGTTPEQWEEVGARLAAIDKILGTGKTKRRRYAEG